MKSDKKSLETLLDACIEKLKKDQKVTETIDAIVYLGMHNCETVVRYLAEKIYLRRGSDESFDESIYPDLKINGSIEIDSTELNLDKFGGSIEAAKDEILKIAERRGHVLVVRVISTPSKKQILEVFRAV